MPQISFLIPLYESHRFFRIICDNIDAHLYDDAEILVSDRHGRDNTAARLAARYAHDPRVRIISRLDDADWITNINDLILASTGTYFRIVPHDDTLRREDTMRLVTALNANDDAVLAYGIVRAIDLDGKAMPHRDQLNAAESPCSKIWGLEDPLSMMWRNRFLGAFKGVVRSEVVRSHNLLIRKTRTLVLSERVWLFALGLMGRFQFVPDAVLVKRYYKGSTSSEWRYTAEVFVDVVDLMQDYCDVYITDPALRAQARLSITENGRASIAAMESGAPIPRYRELVDLLSSR